MALHIDNPQIKVREGAAVWREIDGETVLLALDSSLYLGLNATATTLWPAMVEGTTRANLVKLLVDTYDVDIDRAGRDVDAFVAGCREHDLLR